VLPTTPVMSQSVAPESQQTVLQTLARQNLTVQHVIGEAHKRNRQHSTAL
jgi:hypothetical protein